MRAKTGFALILACLLSVVLVQAQQYAPEKRPPPAARPLFKKLGPAEGSPKEKFEPKQRAPEERPPEQEKWQQPPEERPPEQEK